MPLMVSCSGFGLPMHAQLLRLFVTRMGGYVCVCVIGFGVWTVSVSVRLVCYGPALPCLGFITVAGGLRRCLGVSCMVLERDAVAGHA